MGIMYTKVRKNKCGWVHGNQRFSSEAFRFMGCMGIHLQEPQVVSSPFRHTPAYAGAWWRFWSMGCMKCALHARVFSVHGVHGQSAPPPYGSQYHTQRHRKKRACIVCT